MTRKKQNAMAIGIGMTMMATVGTAMDENWETLSRNFTYNAERVSCVVTTRGEIKNLAIAEEVVIASGYIGARPESSKTTDNHALRILQTLHVPSSIKSRNTGDNEFQIKIEGELGNELNPVIASYTEILHLSPSGIKAECEITLKASTTMFVWNVFRFFNIVPRTFFDGKTVSLVNARGQKEAHRFSPSFDKDSARNITSAKTIVLEQMWGNTTIAADGGTDLILLGRNPSEFHLNFRPALPYSPHPVELEEGRNFKFGWSITID